MLPSVQNKTDAETTYVTARRSEQNLYDRKRVPRRRRGARAHNDLRRRADAVAVQRWVDAHAAGDSGSTGQEQARLPAF